MKNCTIALVLLACMALTLTACKNSRKKTVDEDPSIGLFDRKSAERITAQTNDSRSQISASERGRKMEIPAPMKGAQEMLLKREGYYVSYNTGRRVPNWVAWHLTADHTSGKHYRDGQVFMEDKDVEWPRATDNDYYRSHYDRGHMCPSGDNKWSEKAQTESFLLTNVCPQNHALNKGDWNDLEIQCRYWAKRMGDLYIVAGPIFYNGVRKTVGKNKVAVPDAFFKVILSDGRKAKAIGFVYPNQGGHQDMDRCVSSVDEIERVTGIDFFPLLDDRVEDVVEAASNKRMIDEWNIEKAVEYYNNKNY